MKKIYILLSITLFFIVSCSKTSDFSSFYKENQKDSNFSMNVSSFIANPFIKKYVKDYKKVLRKSKSYKVMVFSKNISSIDKKFKNFIKQNKFVPFVRVSEGDKNIQLFILENKKIINEIIVKIKDGNEENFILASAKTNISEKDLKDILEKSNIVNFY